MNKNWKFEAAYDSGMISLQEITNIVTDLNFKSEKFEYRFRQANDSTDWIVEYKKI